MRYSHKLCGLQHSSVCLRCDRVYESTYSADVQSSRLSLPLVAAGQDHPGSSPCQIQSRGLANASVASCEGDRYTHIKLSNNNKKTDNKELCLTPSKGLTIQCYCKCIISFYTLGIEIIQAACQCSPAECILLEDDRGELKGFLGTGTG